MTNKSRKRSNRHYWTSKPQIANGKYGRRLTRNEMHKQKTRRKLGLRTPAARHTTNWNWLKFRVDHTHRTKIDDSTLNVENEASTGTGKRFRGAKSDVRTCTTYVRCDAYAGAVSVKREGKMHWKNANWLCNVSFDVVCTLPRYYHNRTTTTT